MLVIAEEGIQARFRVPFFYCEQLQKQTIMREPSEYVTKLHRL